MAQALIALHAGEEIMIARISRIKWFAQYAMQIGVDISGSGDNTKFVMTAVASIFFERRVMLIDGEGTTLLESHLRVVEKSAVQLLESPIFLGLKDSEKENLIEAIKEVDKRSRRVREIDAEVAESSRLIDAANPAFIDLQRKQAVRKAKLAEVTTVLAEFVDKLSPKPDKPITIDSARRKEWWTPDIDMFFERLMMESNINNELIDDDEGKVMTELDDLPIPDTSAADDDDDDDDGTATA
jgi:hypothetical protein